MKSKYFKVKVDEGALQTVRNNLNFQGTDEGLLETILVNAIAGCTWHKPKIEVGVLSEENEVVE